MSGAVDDEEGGEPRDDLIVVFQTYGREEVCITIDVEWMMIDFNCFTNFSVHVIVRFD